MPIPSNPQQKAVWKAIDLHIKLTESLLSDGYHPDTIAALTMTHVVGITRGGLRALNETPDHQGAIDSSKIGPPLSKRSLNLMSALHAHFRDMEFLGVQGRVVDIIGGMGWGSK